ncbi:GGDEF domain-containing protein [Vibrio sp. JC009]|uniref:GGDEF domain-containing protein n=1 Tax=Vibrio sp. JC009 TaxID=2912314 RepID=UPI0023AF1A56|nr:GGDEF domain-containing protein [Vibrio sp. JC009]WED24366.1 GGDEF domain-containing protein [Vibrio sp. JC009]
MSFVHSSLFRFIFPLLLVGMLQLGMGNVTLVVQSNLQFAVNLPYFLFAVCILLCQMFSQGRVGMISIAMAATYFVIQTRLQTPLSIGTTKLEFLLLAFIFPVACILASLYSECKLFTIKGFSYIAVLGLLLGWALVTVVHVNESGLSDFWQNVLFTVPEISKLPILIILYSSFVTGWYAIRVLKDCKSIDVAIYTSLCLTLLTFVLFDTKFISSVLFSLGGILLILTIITTSHELAYMDQLTGIPGRRALETEMRHLGRRFTIAMLDVDHFKKFNDTYGHDTGDDVLKLVAAKMMNVGGKARVYRYGGEEFTVLFKGKYTDDAHEFLEELREDIANYEMALRNMDTRPSNNKTGSKNRKSKDAAAKNTVNVTISIGMADSYETSKPEEVIKLADEALYRAKHAGRNRVSD